MNDPPIRDEGESRRPKRGCAIICVSIAVGIILTIAVAFIDDVTGLSIPREAVSIAFLVNGAFVAAGSAIGGWASKEHVLDRAVFGLLAAGAGTLVYAALVGCFGYAFMEYI